MKKWRKTLALLLSAVMLLSMTAFASDADPSFSDVPDDAWYADAVRYVSEKGLMTGTGASKFSPNAELSRAQLVTILWRIAGEPVLDAPVPYSDAEDGIWYSEAVRWAAAGSRKDWPIWARETEPPQDL